MKRGDKVSQHTKAALRELARTWGGGQPQVHPYWDEPEENWIGITTRSDCPWQGVTAVGTVGLSEHSLGFRNDLRVEIVGACASTTDLSEVLSTCAFNVIKDSWPMQPGAIHNGALRMYDLSKTLAHVMFVDPYLWRDGPETLCREGRTITWLMAIPISEAEMSYADRLGPDALTSLFEDRQIDIFDINRRSVV